MLTGMQRGGFSSIIRIPFSGLLLPASVWDEEKSPFITVALLTVAPQPSWTQERVREIDDGMSFRRQRLGSRSQFRPRLRLALDLQLVEILTIPNAVAKNHVEMFCNA